MEVVREFAALGIPWLALGGGGYDLTAVARSWTLAYGVMLGVEFPNELPRGFALEHGIGHLRDSAPPEIPANLRLDVRRHAGETVAAVREHIFPTHGISG